VRSPTALVICVLLLGASHSSGGAQRHTGGPALDSAMVQDLRFRNIGPAITGGRIVEFAVVEDDPSIIYAATASGGAFKTINGGTSWEPVFDRERTVSIGAISVSQSHPNVVWIGTGEANSVRSSSWGNGLYRSLDAGRTWVHRGLDKSQHVGRVVIHPKNPDIVYVAALGALWTSNEERGLYKTVDGGATWKQVLRVSKYTGVADVAMDPRNPDVLYAATFQRERRYYSFLGGGPEGAIFKSVDGGATWQKLTTGLPPGDLGRIGLSVCRTQPDRIYAAIVGPHGGIFRSDDTGASWEKRTGQISTHWYYGQIVCDPNNAERVFVPMTRHYVSEDGGRTFKDDFARGGVHVDHHAIWINPRNSKHILLGTDGGIYISRDAGATWDFQDHLPMTQFYTVAVDMQEPWYYVYGGTQDNSSWGGPSGTRSSDGIVNADWYQTVGGDGFYSQIDPTDPTIVYAESQYGNLVRFNTRTGERRAIQPQPPEGQKYRWNWSAPILISPHDPAVLYFGANILFRSGTRGDAWDAISPDLTRQVDEWKLPLQDKVQPQTAIDLHASTADYGNITSISESPLRAGVLAVGTDDGLVQVTRDGGKNWSRATAFAGVPEQTRVSRVVLSRFAEGTIYVSLDGHQDNNFTPYVFRSTDYGKTWTSIASDLPGDGPVHVIAEHHRNRNLLFVGTEFGVFFTVDAGARWVALRNNLPTVAVHDIAIHPRENDLVLGTHGRGFWILDDLAPLEATTPETLSGGARLYPIRRAWQLHRFVRGRNATGQQRFTAPNPPDGAIVNYYARKDDRVEIDVLDAQGGVVRRLADGRPAQRTGIFRTTWDLRYPSPAPPRAEDDEEGPFTGPRGPFVLPGKYDIRMRVGGAEQRQTVDVLPDPAITLSTEDRRRWHQTLLALADMYRVSRAALTTLDRLRTDLSAARAALTDAGARGEALAREEAVVSKEIAAIGRTLRGEPSRGIALTPGPPPLAQRISQLLSAVEASTALPTADQQRLTRSSHEQLGEVVKRLNALIETTVPALFDQMDAQKVKWTAGRPLALMPLDSYR
jgi:photosystem II stability/assembly factor-like uncharacterized protein